MDSIYKISVPGLDRDIELTEFCYHCGGDDEDHKNYCKRCKDGICHACKGKHVIITETGKTILAFVSYYNNSFLRKDE